MNHAASIPPRARQIDWSQPRPPSNAACARLPTPSRLQLPGWRRDREALARPRRRRAGLLAKCWCRRPPAECARVAKARWDCCCRSRAAGAWPQPSFSARPVRAGPPARPALNPASQKSRPAGRYPGQSFPTPARPCAAFSSSPLPPARARCCRLRHAGHRIGKAPLPHANQKARPSAAFAATLARGIGTATALNKKAERRPSLAGAGCNDRKMRENKMDRRRPRAGRNKPAADKAAASREGRREEGRQGRRPPPTSP